MLAMPDLTASLPPHPVRAPDGSSGARSALPDFDLLRAWLHLANVQLSPRVAALLLSHFNNDPRAILGASEMELEQAGCPPPPLARLLDSQFQPTSEQEGWLTRPDIRLLWQSHPDYPRALRDIPTPPPLLFVRGDLRESDWLGVGMVGSRRATPYGRTIAHKLARELVGHGLTVISGGAVGIDAASHQGALDGGGRTLAIVGCGLDVDYPQANRALFDKIATQGAILSEYPFGSQPEAWRFPQRNRVISGLAQGVLVVEAPESSGALNTVRHALEQGRPILSVPGNIDRPASVGTNNLIKEGATPITETADILRALNMVVVPARAEHQRMFDLASSEADAPEGAAGKKVPAGERASSQSAASRAASSMQSPSASPAPPPHLSAHQRALLTCLSLTPRHIDAVAQEAGVPTVQAGVEMTLMELNGLVRRLPGNTYIRAL